MCEELCTYKQILHWPNMASHSDTFKHLCRLQKGYQVEPGYTQPQNVYLSRQPEFTDPCKISTLPTLTYPQPALCPLLPAVAPVSSLSSTSVS